MPVLPKVILTVSCYSIQIVSPRVDAGEHTMYEIRVDHSIEQLFTVGDNQLNMGEVIQSFGKFLKFYVRAEASEVAMPPLEVHFRPRLHDNASTNPQTFVCVFITVFLVFTQLRKQWKSVITTG